uniref:B30.2/SPRY domain-containing protein n=1 Tax=Erpetoichthys calabaricus TaxID=27687 RepID=A0A8C4XD68_ERPCA
HKFSDEKSDRMTDRAELVTTSLRAAGESVNECQASLVVFLFVSLTNPRCVIPDVTFDPETAHPYLIVSEDGKEVRLTDTRQRVTDNPKRFDRSPGVLVGGKTAWTLGVARESVNRKGGITVTPYNGYWTVWLRNENEYAALIGRPLPLPLRVKLQTVGVFLDYDEGQVSFYNSQSRSHLYTFTDSFTEPLYPYFCPCNNDGGKNAAPLVICPLAEGRTTNQCATTRPPVRQT